MKCPEQSLSRKIGIQSSVAHSKFCLHGRFKRGRELEFESLLFRSSVESSCLPCTDCRERELIRFEISVSNNSTSFSFSLFSLPFLFHPFLFSSSIIPLSTFMSWLITSPRRDSNSETSPTSSIQASHNESDPPVSASSSSSSSNLALSIVVNSPVVSVKVGVLLDGDADYVSLVFSSKISNHETGSKANSLVSTRASSLEPTRVKVDKEEDVLLSS